MRLPSIPLAGAFHALSIRARLTIWYSVVLAIILTLFGSFVYGTLEANLDHEVNQALQQRAREVNSAVRAFRGPLRGQSIVVPPDANIFAQANTFVQIVDFSGEIVSSSANLGDQQLPFDDGSFALAHAGHASFDTVEVGGEPLRLYNAPLLVADQSVGLLQVGRSMRSIRATLEQLRLLMLGGIVAGLLLSGLVGSALARVALRPIDRLTHTARAIGESQDFGRRVAYHGPADEVGLLATTFNEMLGRLQGAYGRVESALGAQRRFVADASHELRTPLTTIRGNAALLRRVRNMKSADRDEALQQIGGEAERMSRLVTDLLTLARADAGQHLRHEPVELGSVVEDVYRQLQLLSNGRKLELETLAEGFVLGDADYLKQLVLILADNAIKYTPDSGRINIGLVKGDGWLVLQVGDTGMGISPSDLPHIFERFYRGDEARSSGGTGLGLSIARWIVDEHGGEITASSEPGKGSVFSVKLKSLEMPVEADPEKSILTPIV